MAFLRFSRDKRGVEHYYLVQPTTNRRGKVRSRVLYWYRTPPDVKVGREPFDADLRRALEAQNPDVSFDWRAIIETPIPSADADKWRERRRAERAAKHAAAAEESAEAADADAAPLSEESGGPVTPAAAAPDAAPPNTGPPAGDANRKRRRRRRGGRGGSAQAGSAPLASAPAPAPGGEHSGD